MEMNVSVVDVSANQKKLQVEIPADRVREEVESRYRDLSQKARIKGFRPGKVPRSILKSYYGKSIENEVSSQIIQDTFGDALEKADLKPLVEADVSETRFEENGSFTYVAIVDVCPPLELEGYKDLKVYRPPVEISEEQEKEELERLRERYAELSSVEEDRPIQEGDIVVTDFTPWVDGNIFEKGKTTDYMMDVGKNTIHPDFDKNIIGHKPGETFSFETEYPSDAPTPEIAGKRVRFDVTVKELKEKKLPELDDEFAKEAKFDSLDELKSSIRERLQKAAEGRAKADIRKQISDQLLQKFSFELSPKVVNREVEHMIAMLQGQFRSQGLNIDTSKFDTPEIRAEYAPQAEKNLRRQLLLQEISKLENIELTDEEKDAIYKETAQYFRMDVERFKREYGDSGFVAQALESKLNEKVLDFLADQAEVTDTPPEEGETHQE